MLAINSTYILNLCKVNTTYIAKKQQRKAYTVCYH